LKKQLKMKFIFALFISTLFIFSFSHFGSSAFTAMVSEKDVFPAGTLVGPVDISGKSKTIAQTMVAEEIEKWKSETEIFLHYKELTVPINIDIVHFDVETTIANAQSGQRNLLLASIETNEIENIIDRQTAQLNLSEAELAKLEDEIISYAHNLTLGSHEISLEDFISVDGARDIIHESVLDLNGISVEMGDWVEELSPIIVPAESQVSIMQVLEEKNLASLSPEVKSVLASGIYQSILPTNFMIIERHIGQTLPEYVKPGYEARVNKGNNMDFVFSNPNKTDYTIELSWVYPSLKIQLIGSPFLYKYEIEVMQSKDQVLKPKTIIQYSPQLQPGQKTVKDEGKNGVLMNVIRKIYGVNSEFIREELIAEDYYAPIERIEVHGLDLTNNNNSENSAPNGELNQTPENDDSPSGQAPSQEGESGIGNENEGVIDREGESEIPEIQPGDGGSTTKPSEKNPSLWGKPNEAEK